MYRRERNQILGLSKDSVIKKYSADNHPRELNYSSISGNYDLKSLGLSILSAISVLRSGLGKSF